MIIRPANSPLLTSLCCLGLLILCGSVGFLPNLAQAAAPANASPSITANDDAFAPLHREFRVLYRSVQNLGGMRDDYRASLEDLRDRVHEFVNEHPEHERAVATELQLSIWLRDHDRVDTLFGQLLLLRPERENLAVGWAAYFLRQGDDERVEQVYDFVLREFPGNVGMRLNLARRLKQRNLYPRVLELIEEFDFDPGVTPEAFVIKAQCLYAENRFEEAVSALQRIPDAALRDRDRLRIDVERTLENATRATSHWEEELALRETDEASDLPRAEIITSRGRIVVELFEDQAPNTVANFITLAEDGFYDNTQFHRVERNFIVQGGDPNTRPDAEGEPGQGGPGYRIPDEHTEGTYRRHFGGVLAMANTGQPDTGGSQFYFTHEPTPHLDGLHTVFGRVLQGLDVVRALEVNDAIETVNVLRKRDHDYEVTKLEEQPEPPAGLPQTDFERLLDEQLPPDLDLN